MWASTRRRDRGLRGMLRGDAGALWQPSGRMIGASAGELSLSIGILSRSAASPRRGRISHSVASQVPIPQGSYHHMVRPGSAHSKRQLFHHLMPSPPTGGGQFGSKTSPDGGRGRESAPNLPSPRDRPPKPPRGNRHIFKRDIIFLFQINRRQT